MAKDIIIFTDDDDYNEFGGDFLDNYINENFPSSTFIITEDNKGVLTNEENDAYMTMEN